VTLSNNRFTVRGVIEKTTDRDYFAFTVPTDSTIELKLRGAAFGTTLDGTLRLYRADGTCVKNMDTTYLGETITRSIPAGTYYAVAMSHGSYGDVGQYTMYCTLTPSTAGASTAPSTGHALARASSGNTFSQTPIRSSSLLQQLESANLI